MSKPRVHSFAMLLDGFNAGPDQDFQHPLGVHGAELMKWYFHTRPWRTMHGQPGGETGIDDEMAERGFGNVGARIRGNRAALEQATAAAADGRDVRLGGGAISSLGAA